MPDTTHHEVLIIGGGNAGISLAARLHRYGVTDIAVVEPKDHHLYQPLFSHIAGGKAKAAEAIRSQASVTPPGVEWIRDGALVINAAANTVTLDSGEQITYGHLVVCPGLQLDWDKIPGLEAAVHSPFGASHYEFALAPKAWTLLSSLKSGTAVFTMPSGPAKCAGAAQKPMYLACDYWKEHGAPRRHPGGHGPALPHGLWGPRRGRGTQPEDRRIRHRTAPQQRTGSRGPRRADRPDPRQHRRHHRGTPLRRPQRRSAAVGTGLAQGHGPAGRRKRRRVRARSIRKPSGTSATPTSGPWATPPRPPIPSAAARCASRPRCWPRTSWLRGKVRR